MAPTETKFHLSRIVASAAVFISLCVPTSTAEVRRCYWCGPLAEQVHRSQRALPCTGALSQDTVCDPGYPYCAVVATSPPYVESRYCVKLYQDECYLLYCNSTRTWRMTCPCRGDLCNGLNTEREEDAFAGLAKVVAKTQNTRIKRSTIFNSGFISMNTNRKNQIDKTDIEEKLILANDTINNEVIRVETNKSQSYDVNTSKEVDGDYIKTSSLSDRTVEDINGTESETTSPTAEVEVKIEQQASGPHIDEIFKNNYHQIDETSIQIDLLSVTAGSSDLKTEIILMSSESTKFVNVTEGNDPSAIPDTQITTPENIEPTAIEVEPMVVTKPESTKAAPTAKLNENTVKPSELLPTAGALLHNETPADKTAQVTTTTTISTTVMNLQHVEGTTIASKPQNNTAVRFDGHIVNLIIVGVILGY